MKVLCKCGAFYLSEGMRCPVCGYELTARDRYNYEKAQKEYRKSSRSKGWERCNFYESKEIEKGAMAEYKRARRMEKEADQWPVSVELISVEYRQSILEGIGRAAIGDWLFGDIGAFVGAASTPHKAKKATFRVKYASGRIGREKVEIGTRRFRELAALSPNIGEEFEEI